MKRHGLNATPKELKRIAEDCLLSCPEDMKEEVMNQVFEFPIVNPTGYADDWRFEEPAS